MSAVSRQIIWLVGQAVKTSPSHGENSGSIPLRAALKSRTLVLDFFCFLLLFEKNMIVYTGDKTGVKHIVMSIAIEKGLKINLQTG